MRSSTSTTAPTGSRASDERPVVTLCPHHRAVAAMLAHRLGRAHHGRRVTRRTMRSIARARPECKETP